MCLISIEIRKDMYHRDPLIATYTTKEIKEHNEVA